MFRIDTNAAKNVKFGGFSGIALIITALFTTMIGCGGWYVYSHPRTKPPDQTQAQVSAPSALSPTDPYAGWKVATSSRALFSIKYPENWTYSRVIGSKDTVEHVTITNPGFRITIDSYTGKDPSNGGTLSSTCIDCLQTNSSTSFLIHGLGNMNLDTVIYALDSGKGNALILREPNGTYYISPPDKPEVHTTFRGISNLPSLAAYQQEAPNAFATSADYATARMIFKSVTY